MTRGRFLPALVALAVLAVATPVEAAADPTVVDVLLLDDNEDPLRIVPRDEVVTLRAVINNTGDQPTNGTLFVRFVVDDGEGHTWTHTARRNVVVTPGNETTVDYRWPTNNRDVGEFSVTITILGASDPGVTAKFDVAETAVPAGSYVERILDHYWFLGAFGLSIVLFSAVLAARKG